MAGPNEILAFGQNAITGTSGNILTQEEYENDAQRLSGQQPGLARVKLNNKIIRQSANMAAGVAQFIANRYEPGVLDDGNLDNIETGMVEAVTTVSTGAQRGQWKPNEVVQVGYNRYPNNVPAFNIFMECINAGTTGATEPTWPEPGEEITEPGGRHTNLESSQFCCTQWRRPSYWRPVY